MNHIISEEEQKLINEIEVKEARSEMCQVNRACYPEAYFEMIEMCKLCGRLF
jgi:hypothetical protein